MNAISRSLPRSNFWNARRSNALGFDAFNAYGIGFAFASSALLWYAILKVVI